MKILIGLFIIFTVFLNASMNNYRSVPIEKAQILKDGKDKHYCSVCGMKLAMFYRTNHAADHDNIHDQYCSVVCMVEDAIVNDKDLVNFKVVDNTSLKFVPSKDATFVVGSKKPGTMSMLSKYAFLSKQKAIEFQKQNGGKLMNFNSLLKLVKNSQAKDMNERKKRKLESIKKGEVLYKHLCKEINKTFISNSQAINYLKTTNACGKPKEKKLNLIAMYLLHKN